MNQLACTLKRFGQAQVLTGYLCGQLEVMSKMELTTFPPESSPTVSWVRLETIFPETLPTLCGFRVKLAKKGIGSTTSECHRGSMRWATEAEVSGGFQLVLAPSTVHSALPTSPTDQRQPQIHQQMPAFGSIKANDSFRILHQPPLCGPSLVAGPSLASQTDWLETLLVPQLPSPEVSFQKKMFFYF